MGRLALHSCVAVAAASLVTSAAVAKTATFRLALSVETLSERDRASSVAPTPSGATLVLNALSEEQRGRLADDLGDVADALARRANPLFVELEDADEGRRLKLLMQSLAPALSAASALSAGRWRSAEGDVVVTAGPHCEEARACFPLGARAPDAELERRARFLAWPIGHAIVLDAALPRDAARVAAALRAEPPARAGAPRAERPPNAVALVLTAADLHGLRRSVGLARVLRQAARVQKALKAEPVESLTALVAAPASGDEVPWLRLPPGGVLVVPRLGALATPEVLLGQVRKAVASARADVAWLAAPVATP